jgi:hypothetical protein
MNYYAANIAKNVHDISFLRHVTIRISRTCESIIVLSCFLLSWDFLDTWDTSSTIFPITKQICKYSILVEHQPDILFTPLCDNQPSSNNQKTAFFVVVTVTATTICYALVIGIFTIRYRASVISIFTRRCYAPVINI